MITVRSYGLSVLSLSIAVFNVMVGFGLFIPFLPYYANVLGATLGLQVGALTSAYMVSRAVAETPFGRLSDRIGRRPIIALGLSIYTRGTLGFPFAWDWTHLILLRAVQGIGGAMLWPSATALIADTIPPGGRGRALGFFNTWAMVGLLVGPALGGAIQFYGYERLALSEIESYRLPFYVGGVFAAISSLIVFIFVKEAPKRAANDSTPTTMKVSGISKPFKRTFKALLTVRFANGFAITFIQPLLAFYVHEALGLERTDAVLWIAASFFVSGLAGATVQIPAGSLADKGGRKKIMLVGVLAAQLCTFAIPLAGAIVLIVALMGLRSSFSSLYQPSLISLQEDIIPRDVRGKLTGLVEAFSDMGAILGPLFGFFLYDFFDKSYPFYASALISSISIMLFTAFARDPRLEEAEK